MIKKIIILSTLFISTISFSSSSSFDKNIDIFRNDVKPLVSSYLNKPTVRAAVELLNKEFNKEILIVKTDSDGDYSRKNKKIDLSENELMKLKEITTYLIKELVDKKDKSPAISDIIIIESQFDL